MARQPSAEVPTEQPGVRVFISHSAKDVDIATALVDLLAAALRLHSRDIRCTSVDGYRLQGGADTDNQIQREVVESDVFLGIISDESIQSMYVVFELGARWGSKRHFVPLLANGIPASILSGPLQRLNALSCDQTAQMHQLIREVAAKLDLTPENPAVYERHLQTLVSLPARAKRASKSAGSVASNSHPSLSDVDITLLQHIASSFNQITTIADAATALSLSYPKAEYLLDELTKQDLVSWSAYMDSSAPARYRLDHKGRAVLVKLGLL